MPIKEVKTRKNYYFGAFLLGFVYFLVHFALRAFITGSLIQTVDMWYLWLDGIFVVGFIIKDAFDEASLHKGKDPVGPSWFEHSTFIAMVGFHGVMIGLLDPPSIYVTLEWIFAILLFIDAIWDVSQDLRSSPDR